jgi:hypothetical protein
LAEQRGVSSQLKAAQIHEEKTDKEELEARIKALERENEMLRGVLRGVVPGFKEREAEAEKYTTIRKELTQQVRTAMTHYEEEEKIRAKQGVWYINLTPGDLLENATLCAVALKDKNAAVRLLPKIFDRDALLTKELEVLIGGETKAKDIVASLLERGKQDDFGYYQAGLLAVGISDKSIVRSILRRLKILRELIVLQKLQ